jgi:hypothetical protein
VRVLNLMTTICQLISQPLSLNDLKQANWFNRQLAGVIS